jgi:hypothetical protein
MPANAVVLNGQIGLLSQESMLAGSGNLYSVNCQTPGTAIAYAVLTAFSATANGLFVIANTGVQTIYLKRLTLFQTATVATGTTWSFEAYNETGVVAGTTAVVTRTPVQIGAGGGNSLVATVQAFNAGAITIPSAVGARKLQGQWWVPLGVNVIKDVVTIDFGSDAPVSSKTGLTAARATDVALLTGQAPAIVIPPGTTSWINMWGCGTAAPSFEYQLTLIAV